MIKTINLPLSDDLARWMEAQVATGRANDFADLAKKCLTAAMHNAQDHTTEKACRGVLESMAMSSGGLRALVRYQLELSDAVRRDEYWAQMESTVVTEVLEKARLRLTPTV